MQNESNPNIIEVALPMSSLTIFSDIRINPTKTLPPIAMPIRKIIDKDMFRFYDIIVISTVKM